MKGAFLVRLMIAASLYTILGRAAVWFDPISNAILVFGSRFFLILSPFFFSRFKEYAIPVSILLAAIGASLLTFSSDKLLLVGAVCMAIGVSVAGYLIRAYASENITAAARNKVAINAGIFLAGLALSLPVQSNITVAVGCLTVLLVAAYLSRNVVSTRKNLELPAGSKATRLVQLAWVLLGLTMGIKLYAPFTLLPQYIASENGFLPQWYGLVVLASSLFIVISQKIVVRVMGLLPNELAAKIATWGAMLCGLFVIATPDGFGAATLIGALVWVLILSLIECVASYLDVFGAKDNCLFIKELAVGAGGGTCALISRFSPPAFAGTTLAFAGILFLATAVVILHRSSWRATPKFGKYDAN